MNLARDHVRDMGVAEQLALRVCSKRFSLSPQQIMQVREFVVRYEEELGWLGDEGEASGGMVAPTGGWPKWQPLGTLPAEDATAKALDPSELFKKVAPSVVRVEGVSASSATQGSGVAVSSTQALTNCHVLEGALKITIKQQNREWGSRASKRVCPSAIAACS